MMRTNIVSAAHTADGFHFMVQAIRWKASLGATTKGAKLPLPTHAATTATTAKETTIVDEKPDKLERAPEGGLAGSASAIPVSDTHMSIRAAPAPPQLL